MALSVQRSHPDMQNLDNQSDPNNSRSKNYQNP